MWRWIVALDRVLRGETTRPDALRDGHLPIPVFGLSVVATLLGLIAGFCVGWFALINRQPPAYWQALASAVKVPLLFFLTLVVTFPSLYVFNALVGSRLSVATVFRLLVAGTAVTMAVLASFGPITAFFSVTTDNYAFMVLLNVLLFAVAGVLGLVFMLQTLHRLSLAVAQHDLPEPAPRQTTAAEPHDTGATPNLGALDQPAGHVLGRHVKAVFRCWLVAFALVGAQMAWVLRPFIGDPRLPFVWFRPRESNFFEALWRTLHSLLS